MYVIYFNNAQQIGDNKRSETFRISKLTFRSGWLTINHKGNDYIYPSRLITRVIKTSEEVVGAVDL